MESNRSKSSAGMAAESRPVTGSAILAAVKREAVITCREANRHIDDIEFHSRALSVSHQEAAAAKERFAQCRDFLNEHAPDWVDHMLTAEERDSLARLLNI